MTVFGKITAKNQTTIPAAVREALGLKPGDRVAYEVDEDGTVRLVRAPSRGLTDLAGMFQMPKHLQGKTWDQIRAETHAAIAEERLGDRD